MKSKIAYFLVRSFKNEMPLPKMVLNGNLICFTCERNTWIRTTQHKNTNMVYVHVCVLIAEHLSVWSRYLRAHDLFLPIFFCCLLLLFSFDSLNFSDAINFFLLDIFNKSIQTTQRERALNDRSIVWEMGKKEDVESNWK